MGYDLPNEVPAWRVEVSAHIAWLPSSRVRIPESDGTFHSRREAERHAEDFTGVRAVLVPHCIYSSRIIETTREPDWRDRLRAFINQRPLWSAP